MSITRTAFQRVALIVISICLIAILGTNLVKADHNHEADREHLHAEEYTYDVQTTSSYQVSGRDDVYFDESFSATAEDYLIVELASSDLVVETTSGSEARVVITGRGSDAAQEFERRRFSADYSGGRFRVKSDPENNRRRGRVEASFTVTVTIPHQFDVSIATASGDVRVGDLLGQLDANSASGDIQLGTVDGTEIEINTASGDISADALTGILSFSTASGDLVADAISGHSVSMSSASGDMFVGNLNATTFESSTASGSIEIDHFEAAASIQSASGDVSLDLNEIADLSIETVSGDIDLALPNPAGASVNLHSPDIEIAHSLDFSGSRERREARGTIGGGGPQFDLTTMSGSIELERD